MPSRSLRSGEPSSGGLAPDVGSTRMTRRGSRQVEDGYASSSASASAAPPADRHGSDHAENGLNGGDSNVYVLANGAKVQDEDANQSMPGRTLRLRVKAVIRDSDDESDDKNVDAEGDYAMEEHVTKNGGRRGRVARDVPSSPSSSEEEKVNYTRQPKVIETTTLHGRQTRRPVYYQSDSSDDNKRKRKGNLRRGGNSSRMDNFVEPDEEYDRPDEEFSELKRSSRMEEKRKREQQQSVEQKRRMKAQLAESVLTKRSEPRPRNTRNSQKADLSFEHDEEDGEDTEEEEGDLEDDDDDDDDDDDNDVGVSKPTRRLRNKPKIDYYNLPALEAPPEKMNKGKNKQRDNPFIGLPPNMTNADWAALFPDKNGNPDSSDDDGPDFSTPQKAALFSSKAGAAAAGFGNMGAGGMLAGGAAMDMAGSGAPNNLGKVGNAASLADTDPLGVPSAISFDSVGGLGNHVQQLKEMVSLPLLYPEVFERFNITPPRGVLFHGPPGTGKTLLARALAASCSTDGRKISFFMRKGADCLSKWVGEAERQLRLLFEEAKNSQPSIIFFDEIDGLAPVRSSKQEQIHASIVSTLLALMDGMDGRGQVIVIGATNRPDAIDPALRRPGRFDREFYFPLPNLEARRKILDIHTSGWQPPIQESFKDELAHLTKGYGGADLRALCTEAALNAVQRTYPQIYKTNDRLVIKPETIDVTARDFVISQKNMIPSTARATSSSAAPIPPQLLPLLTETFERAKEALGKVLPEVKKPNILEEAEWEDDGGGFEREKMLQEFETLRIFRPRMLIAGSEGMGQTYIGAAILHHLEGFHVQTLDLATLVADSSRTMEAACVQLFVEAKRHKPSILFMPSLITWVASVTDTVRSTVKGLLDSLDPSDPILLLAVVDGPLNELPSDVRSWFGYVKGNRVMMTQPNAHQRRAFFEDVIKGVKRPPGDFPDAVPRRKRVLEVLPVAPPLPPRQPTAAEIQQLQQNDQRLLEYLKWRLGPVLNELKKRHKRFNRSLYDDWRSDDLAWRQEQQRKGEPIVGLGTQPYHHVDLDVMHLDLYKGLYHTPDDFLADVLRIQINAEINAILESDAEAPLKAGQMVNHTKVMLDQTFDNQFRIDCARMAERMKEREKATTTQGHEKKGKGKGREIISDVSAVAAKAAAGGGLLRLGTRSRPANGAKDDSSRGPIEVEDIGAIERKLKRSRKEQEHGQQLQVGDNDLPPQSGGEEEELHGPSKRLREEISFTTSDHVVENGVIEDSVRPDPHPSSLPLLTAPFSDVARGTLSLAPLAEPTPFISSYFGDPAPPFSSSMPSGALLAPPMGVGAQPESHILSSETMDPVAASISKAEQEAYGHALINNVISPSEETVKHVVRFVPQSNTQPTSRDVTPSPENGSVPADLGQVAASPIQIDPATPEPEPTHEFVCDESSAEKLRNTLTDITVDLNIDQLEQLRAACYDIIWRNRKDWVRRSMIEELQELAVEFVEDVSYSTQESSSVMLN